MAAAYWPAFHNHFVGYDDDRYVFDNPFLSRGLSWSGIQFAFTSFGISNWHPVTWLSLLADYTLWGLDPRGYHLTSFLLHLANALLLWRLLTRMTARSGPSFFAAALFAVHPLHVESVVWISERKDVLCGLFLMLATGSWLNYVRCPSRSGYARTAAWFTLGLLSKPMLVTFPFLLLTLDLWPLGRLAGTEPGLTPTPPGARGAILPRPFPFRRFGRLLLEKAPLLFLSLLSAGMTLLAQQRGGATRMLETEAGLHPDLILRLSNAAVSCVAYLGKMFWPFHLAPLYPFPMRGIPWTTTAAAVAILTACTAAALWRVRRSPGGLTGWLWYLGALLPVLGLVQVGVQSMADRYTYIPLIGLYGIIAWTASGVWVRLPVSGIRRNRIGLLAGGLLLAGLAVRTHDQAGIWRDSLTLFQHATRVTTGNAKMHYNYGYALRQAGRFEESLNEYQKSLSIQPQYAQAEMALGDILCQLGRPADAERHYLSAIAIQPRSAAARVSFARLRMARGQFAEAQAQLEATLQGEPDHLGARLLLGDLWVAQGQTGRAADQYRAALERAPDQFHTLIALARIRAADPDPGLRDGAEAVRLADRACRLLTDPIGNPAERPAAIEALSILAAAHAEQGDFRKAEAIQKAAIQLAAQNPSTDQTNRLTGELEAYREHRPVRYTIQPVP
jgi:tetratricopeptide (TPR) repeat protein